MTRRELFLAAAAATTQLNSQLHAELPARIDYHDYPSQDCIREAQPGHCRDYFARRDSQTPAVGARNILEAGRNGTRKHAAPGSQDRIAHAQDVPHR
jgi:hypothetical protein